MRSVLNDIKRKKTKKVQQILLKTHKKNLKICFNFSKTNTHKLKHLIKFSSAQLATNDTVIIDTRW